MLPELVMHSLPALITIGAAIVSTNLLRRGRVRLGFLTIMLMSAADVALFAASGYFDPLGIKWIVDGVAHIL